VSGGIVLLIAGVWVVSQVLGGNALKRLKIVDDSSVAASPGSGSSAGGSIGGMIGPGLTK